MALWIGVPLVIVALLSVAVVLSAVSVRHQLLDARGKMLEGRTELLSGKGSDAETSFAGAQSDFAAAQGGPSGLLFKTLQWVPFLGRTPETTLALAQAGARAAEAGALISKAVADLPGGLASLAPGGGGIQVDRLAPLTQAVVQADGAVADALSTVQQSPDSLVLGPVSQARGLLEEELGTMHAALASGSSILQGLPKFLGTIGTKRYFFAAQDPAELRGTGGVMGAYSILTVRNGRFSFSPFRPIQSIPIPPLSSVPPPSAEYAANYNQFRGGERFWLAINLTPDFPTAAQAILNSYAVAVGDQLDGVILVDPFALQALLRIVGPTAIPDLGKRVTPANVVSLTTNEAFSLFPDAATRKRVLGSVASGVFQRFIHGPKPGLPDLKILATTMAEGHVLVFSTDPTMQQGLSSTGVGGALPLPQGDFLSVIENSAGENKVDFYQDRSVTYAVQLAAGGSAGATTDVRLTNNAPTKGEPTYVIGPHPGYSKVGESVQLMNIYAGAGSRLTSARRDGSPVKLWAGSELGQPFYQDYFGTPSGGTSDLSLSLSLPHVWEPTGAGGVYDLTFLNQTTIRPTTLRIQVVVPPGMHIVTASQGMTVQGGQAVWSGTPSHRMEFEVTFRS